MMVQTGMADSHGQGTKHPTPPNTYLRTRLSHLVSSVLRSVDNGNIFVMDEEQMASN